jgi:hypothetical protein
VERTKFEKEIAEAFEFENPDKKRGKELIQSILDARVTEATKDNKKPKTDDDVKIHPLYRDLEKRYQTDLAKKDSEMQEEIQVNEQEFEKKETWNKVKKLAKIRADERQPILYTDRVKAENQLEKLLFDELKTQNYKVENDDVLMLDAEGKRIEDKLGHPVTFSKFVDNVLDSNFEFPKAEERQSGGNKNTYQNHSKTPSTEKEYLAFMENPNYTLEQKSALSQAKRRGELILKD